MKDQPKVLAVAIIIAVSVVFALKYFSEPNTKKITIIENTGPEQKVWVVDKRTADVTDIFGDIKENISFYDNATGRTVKMTSKNVKILE